MAEVLLEPLSHLNCQCPWRPGEEEWLGQATQQDSNRARTTWILTQFLHSAVVRSMRSQKEKEGWKLMAIEPLVGTRPSAGLDPSFSL